MLDRKHGVGKLIMSSSPSTRFDGNDIDGLKEDDLSVPKKFLQVLHIGHRVPFTTMDSVAPECARKWVGKSR